MEVVKNKPIYYKGCCNHYHFFLKRAVDDVSARNIGVDTNREIEKIFYDLIYSKETKLISYTKNRNPYNFSSVHSVIYVVDAEENEESEDILTWSLKQMKT